MKIADIEQRKSSYLLNDLRNFNEILRKYVTYDNIKSHKKDTFLEKPQGRVSNLSPTSFLGLRKNYKNTTNPAKP